MFWCTAPFLVTTVVLLPILARPDELIGKIVLGVVVALCSLVLLGLWNTDRFQWCWRIVGGIIAAGYLIYLMAMITEGNLFGDGRRSASNAFNALLGLIAFGYPGFLFAIFGRFTWNPEPDDDEYMDEFSELDLDD